MGHRRINSQRLRFPRGYFGFRAKTAWIQYTVLRKTRKYLPLCFCNAIMSIFSWQYALSLPSLFPVSIVLAAAEDYCRCCNKLINTVDEVPQRESSGCSAYLSEIYLLPIAAVSLHTNCIPILIVSSLLNC